MDHRNAGVFPAGEYRAFAAALQQRLTDPKLYAALSSYTPST